MTETVDVTVSDHARTRYQRRADELHLTPRVEDAWRQAHDLPGGEWLDGEAARYDPVSRCVLVVRDGVLRTAIYAPTAKPAIQQAVRNAGWHP